METNGLGLKVRWILLECYLQDEMWKRFEKRGGANENGKGPQPHQTMPHPANDYDVDCPRLTSRCPLFLPFPPLPPRFTYLTPSSPFFCSHISPPDPSPLSSSSFFLSISLQMECSDSTAATNNSSCSSSSPRSLSPSSSSSPPPPNIVLSPCAACKILRRRCADKCVLAPYFPPTDPAKFTTAHRVFGASNIIKFLQVPKRASL